MDSSRCQKDDIIRYALEKCGIEDMSGVVMVGDRKHDVCGAKKIGVDSIGVLWGYGSGEELCTAGATHIAETIDDLLRLIEE